MVPTLPIENIDFAIALQDDSDYHDTGFFCLIQTISTISIYKKLIYKPGDLFVFLFVFIE